MYKLQIYTIVKAYMYVVTLFLNEVRSMLVKNSNISYRVFSVVGKRALSLNLSVRAGDLFCPVTSLMSCGWSFAPVC